MAGKAVTPPTPLTPIFYAQGDGLEAALLNALAARELDALKALHAQVWPLLIAPNTLDLMDASYLMDVTPFVSAINVSKATPRKGDL